MIKSRYFLVSLMIGATVLAGACTKDGKESLNKQNVAKPAEHSDAETPNAGIIKVIKNGRLANFKSATIGSAFDSYKYLTKKDWQAAPLKSGHVTVDFAGWFEPNTLNDRDIKDGVTARGLNVKFVIEPDGSYYVFMVSKLESKSDGKIYSSELQDSAGILASIYANRKISL